MKKFITLGLIYFLGVLTSCFCPDEEPMTEYMTIHTVSGSLFSFDENGIYPHFDNFNKNELGIGVLPDSISIRKEFGQNFSSLNQVYACEPNTYEVHENAIDSVYIFTLYDFDEAHPAGSLVSDILKPIDNMGDSLEEVDISTMSFFNQYFKFSAVPASDTLQFLITGRISDKGDFQVKTERVILKE